VIPKFIKDELDDVNIPSKPLESKFDPITKEYSLGDRGLARRNIH